MLNFIKTIIKTDNPEVLAFLREKLLWCLVDNANDESMKVNDDSMNDDNFISEL